MFLNLFYSMKYTLMSPRHGAQVGYLLRRWTHSVDGNMRFVGLSATLSDATQFFATLTGVRETYISEVFA